jgi:hypothetical protein
MDCRQWWALLIEIFGVINRYRYSLIKDHVALTVKKMPHKIRTASTYANISLKKYPVTGSLDKIGERRFLLLVKVGIFLTHFFPTNPAQVSN